MGSNRDGLTRAAVVQAAEDCLSRYGVRRTSMADVAEKLGVARQTLYRQFATRSELLEFIASKRITDLARQLKGRFQRFSTLEEALVEGSVISIESGTSDALLAEIFEHNAEHSFEQFLFKGSDEVRAEMLELWTPLIDDARARGTLRAGLSNESVVEWIRNVHVVATMRDDYGPDEMRAMFRDYLLPSVIDEPSRSSKTPAANVR